MGLLQSQRNKVGIIGAHTTLLSERSSEAIEPSHFPYKRGKFSEKQGQRRIMRQYTGLRGFSCLQDQHLAENLGITPRFHF